MILGEFDKKSDTFQCYILKVRYVNVLTEVEKYTVVVRNTLKNVNFEKFCQIGSIRVIIVVMYSI